VRLLLVSSLSTFVSPYQQQQQEQSLKAKIALTEYLAVINIELHLSSSFCAPTKIKDNERNEIKRTRTFRATLTDK
jgi:hypothetical protein